MIEKVKRKLLDTFFPQIGFYRALIKDERSYLVVSGWKEGLKRGYPSKPNGSPIPWMNFPVISFLEDRLQKDFTVFEYGSGYSTLFYAERVKFIRTIEYNKDWYKLIKERLPANAEIHFVEKDVDGEYCRSINSTDEKYDVVVIDGRDRVNCLKQAVKKLTERGVLLLDDSQREKYEEGLKFAIKNGYSTLKFEGISSQAINLVSTTIIYKSGNCLNI